MAMQLVQPILEGQHVRLEPLSEAHVDGLFDIGQQQDD